MDSGVKYGRYEQVNGEVVNRLNKEMKRLSNKLLELRWRPIKTAPKDETAVDSGPACVRDATHWMPVPRCIGDQPINRTA